VATVSLSFLNRRTIDKQVCRVCGEFAELKTERLCTHCTRVKAQLRSRFPDAARRGIAEEHCTRSNCVCGACGGRTLDSHPSYPTDPTRPEIHFHPRCHELWLELGLGVQPKQDTANAGG
jgi:hypothetical protein